LILETIGGVVYGFVIFIIGIEGGTVPLIFTFSVLATLISLFWAWGHFRERPVVTFFMIGYGLATLLFIGWWLYWGGFPQFSHLGWI
jgi:hypothetical protein